MLQYLLILISLELSISFKMNRLGFVGLGIMGKGMLKNLVTKLDKSTFVVWNRSPEVIAEFQSLYPGKIEAATSAADVVSKTDVTFCKFLYGNFRNYSKFTHFRSFLIPIRILYRHVIDS